MGCFSNFEGKMDVIAKPVRKHNILVVDDEKSNIMTLTHILGPIYTIYAARDGQDAIEVANEHVPDLILLDILMPGMNGFEVITHLKKNPVTKNIPVVFVSGLDSADDEEHGLTLGAADYISKPFNPAIVKLRVHNQIMMLEQLRTIERLSMVDQLTEIPNRRSFDSRMAIEWARSVRDSIPISIMMIDIDFFKQHNDKYGHQQGDQALIIIAKTIKTTLKRLDDYVARWGGEEFVVLLQNTNKEGALNIAEQIRKDVEKAEIPLPDGTHEKLTISIGAYTLVPVKDSSVATFISAADDALYTAKEKGRNQVCFYSKAKHLYN
jgi:diguanylate cyclase (GGDEF)-like protein